MEKIGVILDNEEKISSLMEGIKIEIYEKVFTKWNKIREVEVCLPCELSINYMSQMRKFLSELVIELQDCKILIGSIIIGLPYMILDKEGLMLCEADEISEELFNEVASDYQASLQKSINKVVLEEYPSAPFETSQKGVYELDMRKLQQIHPEISSKMALIPFLKEAQFEQLNIYCNHIFPWIDRELTTKKLIYHTEKLEGEGYKIEIKNV